MTDKRLQLLLDLMKKNDLDAVAINPGPALTYLTGLRFHLMERPTLLVISRTHQPVLILPELEIGKVNSSRIPLQPVTFGDDPALWPHAFLSAMASLSETGLLYGLLETAASLAVIIAPVLAGLLYEQDPYSIYRTSFWAILLLLALNVFMLIWLMRCNSSS